jgi:hypothetical protein
MTKKQSRRAQIEHAFRTRQVQLRLWSDGEGRIYRIQLTSSSGDAELDAAVRDDVLSSLMLDASVALPTLPASDFSARGPTESTFQIIQRVE